MRSFLLIILVLALAALAFARCPNACSGKGTCTSNRCHCQKGYFGMDCSYRRTLIAPGQALTGVIARRRWHFFIFSEHTVGQSVQFSMYQTTTSGKCDLYFRRNYYPSTTRYNARSISYNRNHTFTISGGYPRGTYAFGVYGRRGCSYQAQLAVSGINCPSGCSGRGSCVAGKCMCNAGYGGIGCVNSNRSLAVGHTLSGTVAKGKWQYFYNDVTSQGQDALNFQITGTGDCDLYVKNGAFPTLFVWDRANATTPTNNVNVDTVKLDEPAVGRWYAGVYGYKSCSFQIKAAVTEFTAKTCPNKCSNHGTCSNGACHCKSGYFGRSCYVYTPTLRIGAFMTGYVSSGQWNYFRAQVYTSGTVTITLNRPPSSNLRGIMYVRKGLYPSRTSYTSRCISTGSNGCIITLVNPGSSRFYIGVYGYRPGAYTVKIARRTTLDCGSHGTLHNSGSYSYCVCSAGYYGTQCQTKATPITSGTSVSGTVMKGQWNYYSLRAAVNEVTFAAHEVSTVGKVWMFASINQLPLLNKHIGYNITRTSALHTIDISRRYKYTQNYIIGVYGSPYIPSRSTSVSYKLSAFGF